MQKNRFKKIIALLLAVVIAFVTTITGFRTKAEASGTIQVVFHLTCSDGNYNKYGASPNLYYWTSADGAAKDFTVSGSSATATINVSAENASVGWILRWGNSWDYKDYSEDRFVDIVDVTGGTVHVYVTSGKANFTTDKSSASKGTKLTSAATTDYENIKITAGTKFSDSELPLVKVYDVVNNKEVGVNSISYTGTEAGTSHACYNIKLKEKLDVFGSYIIKYANGTLSYVVNMPDYYASKEFDELYTYKGNDLGASYSKNSTTFKVWAPLATNLKVNLYESGTKGADDLIQSVAMTKSDNGIWTAVVSGDLNKIYYTYKVTVKGVTSETIDPYAVTTGVNGNRGMILDLDSTDPAGWDKDTNPFNSTHYEDVSIYELHIRDFSYEASSGVSAANRGKYLAFTETGTKNSYGQSTGIDYLADLGITHVHLLPTFDYASVDETKLSKDQFNWGYDPQNFNAPEGSYSTDPYNGEVRVKEFKQMVQSLHNNGIGVIMDVVYGHVANANEFSVNILTPGYYSRTNSNGSYCGNDTATEREMNRKYIVDSMVYWAKEYHIDGFRIDQVGLFDTETVTALTEALQAVDPNVILYGEGWVLPTVPSKDVALATQGNAKLTPDFGYFNDAIRDSVKGNVFYEDAPGYVAGNYENITTLMKNLNAGTGWASAPNQVVNYNSCHDNYTLYDKLTLASAGSSRADIIKQNNLATAILFTSQGVPFIQAGEELLRSKPKGDGTYEHNSYNSASTLNSIKWDDLNASDVQTTMEYYKGLMKLRAAHPAFRMTSYEEINANFSYSVKGTNGVIAYKINGGVNGDTSDGTFVIFNPNKTSTSVTLPSGTWDIYAMDDKAGTKILGTAVGKVSVSPVSCMILINNAKFENDEDLKPVENGVYFEKPANWGSKVYAYIWDSVSGEILIGSWPGTAIENVQGDIYGFTTELEEDNKMIIFSDEKGNQTVDLQLKKNGYYNKNGLVKIVTVKEEEMLEATIQANGSSLPQTVTKGDTVTLTAGATGGSGGYTYSFLINNKDTGEWYRYGNGVFNSSNTHTWKASSTGNKVFYVEVKDSNGNVVRSAGIDVKVNDRVSEKLSISAKANKSSAVKGDSVIITAAAAGGSGSYTYSFLINNKDTGEWYRFGGFKTLNTLTWKATTTGNKVFYAEVKDSAGTVVRSSGIRVTVSNSASSLGITAKTSSGNPNIGSKVVITGTATGGSGSYTYSFLVLNTGTNEWYRYNKTFKTSNTLVWTATAGHRKFFAEVKDSTGKVVRSSGVRVDTK